MNQLELMHEDVVTECSGQSLFTDEPLPKRTRGSRLSIPEEEETDRDTTAKVGVKITGLPIGSEEVAVTSIGH